MKLTKREYAILRFLADGKNISEIADELNYSRDWISEVAGNMYKKMEAKNAAHAVAIAFKEGLIN